MGYLIQSEASNIERWLKDHKRVNKIIDLEYLYKTLKIFKDYLFKFDLHVRKIALDANNVDALNSWENELSSHLELILKALELVESSADQLNAFNIENPEITKKDIERIRKDVEFALDSGSLYRSEEFRNHMKKAEKEWESGEFTED